MKTIYNPFTEKQYERARQKMKMKNKALAKAVSDFKNEHGRQLTIIGGCTGIALYENWGWRGKRLQEFYNEVDRAADECSLDNGISMIEMCENETGIVVYQEGFSGDYKELLYFQPEEQELTVEQEIVMRKKQMRWVAPQIYALLFLALHRRYGFGPERIERLKEQMEEVRSRYKGNEKKIHKEHDRITGIELIK